jgi:hypothetical protein
VQRLLILLSILLIAWPAEANDYSSIEQGIKVTMPEGETLVRGSDRQPEDPKVLAVVTVPEDDWRFELRRVELTQPMPLESRDLPEGGRQIGMLEGVAEELQRAVGGELIRMDLAPLADADAGVFAIRYNAGPASLLRQEALVRSSDELYFRMSLVGPAPAVPQEQLADDPDVRRMVATFNEAFNSIEMIDQAALIAEQDQRLEATRAFFIGLNQRGRLATAAHGETWCLVERQGMPIGFARMIEEPADEVPDQPFQAFDERSPALDPLLAEGVRVGIRLRIPDAGEDGGTLNRASWSYASRELDIEDFREMTLIRPPAEEADEAEEADDGSYALVIGQMRSRRVPVRGPDISRGPGLGSEPTFSYKQQGRLEVTFTLDGEVVGEPLERDLSPFYVPKAVDHLLPRLLATWGSKNYMVASYVPEERQVYTRYLDVLPAEVVKVPVGGEREAIVVESRLGYAGDVTKHFIDAKTFRWLGSSTPSQAIRIVPTTREAVAAAFPEDLS